MAWFSSVISVSNASTCSYRVLCFLQWTAHVKCSSFNICFSKMLWKKKKKNLNDNVHTLVFLVSILKYMYLRWITLMNIFSFYCLFEKHQCLSVHVNDWPFLINDCMKVQLIVRLCANCIFVSNTQLIVTLCNWFSIGVNDRPLRDIESIFVKLDCPKVQLFIRWC